MSLKISVLLTLLTVEGVSEFCPVRCADHHTLFGCPVSLRHGQKIGPKRENRRESHSVTCQLLPCFVLKEPVPAANDEAANEGGALVESSPHPQRAAAMKGTRW